MTTPRLRHLFTQRWPRLALITGCWITSRVAVLAAGLLLKAVFDRLAGNAGPLSVWTLVALLSAAYLAQTVLWVDVILGRLELWHSERSAAQLRHNTLAGILAQPAATAVRHKVGDVVDRFNSDVSELRVFPLWVASNVGRVSMVVPMLAVMLAISPVVTIGVVIPFAAVVAVAKLIDRRIARFRRDSRTAAAGVSTVIGEAVRAAGTLRALGHQEHAVSRLAEAGRHRERVAVREQTSGEVQSTVYELASNLAAGLVMVLAASRLASGELTVGDMALFVFFASNLGEVVFVTGLASRKFRQARVSLERLSEVAGGGRPVTAYARTWLRSEPPEPEPLPSDVERLESFQVSGLSYAHDAGGASGIDGLDLDLKPGTLTVLTGPVGTGKTTALRAALGLLPGQAGTIRWNGEEVAEPGRFLVAPRVAYVPQVPNLFTGTVAGNVRLGADGGVGRAVDTAMLSADVDAMPEGADTLIGVGGRRLSGGQAQRVALARALQRNPRLLVLDDVDSALDAVTARELWDRLLADGDRTILAVSHNPYALSRADAVVTLG